MAKKPKHNITSHAGKINKGKILAATLLPWTYNSPFKWKNENDNFSDLAAGHIPANQATTLLQNERVKGIWGWVLGTLTSWVPLHLNNAFWVLAGLPWVERAHPYSDFHRSSRHGSEFSIFLLLVRDPTVHWEVSFLWEKPWVLKF